LDAKRVRIAAPAQSVARGRQDIVVPVHVSKGRVMTSIAKRLTIGLAVFAATAASIGPAFAQSSRMPAKDVSDRNALRAFAQQRPAAAPYLQQGFHVGSDGQIYSSTGSPVPGYVLSMPNRCWTEAGYGQWIDCSAD
jgi:hypothetical protein